MTLVTMGEVHTGLLHHSTAVSPALATRLLGLVEGQRVRRSERPIAYAISPEILTGVDCSLASTGGKVRGVGTTVSRAAITGGHVLQGSAFTQVKRGHSERRLPWSHYLANPGVIETVTKADGRHLVAGFLGTRSAPGTLDLGAISTHTMDTVQDQTDLDHVAAFRSSRTRLRWAVTPTGGHQAMTFTIDTETSRTVRLPHMDLDVAVMAELCEDLALHDWLLTTLLSLIDRSRIGSGKRSEVVTRLRPAIDFLLHLWMPAARIDNALTYLWQGLERRPGLTRQWKINVSRVRDLLALATMESLGEA